MSDKKDLSFIDNIRELAAMPKISTDLMEMFQDTSRSWKEISDKINLDPSLASFVIKTSNSPFYGIKHEIRSTEGAIRMLGLAEIRSILMSFFLRNLYTGPGESEFMDDLWAHSISVAVFAKVLSSYLKINVEGVYLAGLLHDIGKLVIHFHDPDTYEKIIDKEDDLDQDIIFLEEEAFHFTHIDTGYYLLDKWKFSDFVKNAVLFHHFFISYRGNDPIVGLVAFANQLVHKYIDGKPAPLDIYLKKYGLTTGQVETFAEKTIGVIEEYHSLMVPGDAGKKKPLRKVKKQGEPEAKKEKSFLSISAPAVTKPEAKGEDTPETIDASPVGEPVIDLEGKSSSKVTGTDLSAHISKDTPYEGVKLFLQLQKVKEELSELRGIFDLFDYLPPEVLQDHLEILGLLDESVNRLVQDPEMASKLNLKKLTKPNDVFDTAADEVAYIDKGKERK